MAPGCHKRGLTGPVIGSHFIPAAQVNRSRYCPPRSSPDWLPRIRRDSPAGFGIRNAPRFSPGVNDADFAFPRYCCCGLARPKPSAVTDFGGGDRSPAGVCGTSRNQPRKVFPGKREVRFSAGNIQVLLAPSAPSTVFSPFSKETANWITKLLFPPLNPGFPFLSE